MSKSKDGFTEKEKEDRLQAALRGSRVTGHKPMTDIPKKKTKTKKKPGK
jgi:hypothetical protein